MQGTTKPLTPQIVADLDAYKIPALAQKGLTFAAGGPRLWLASKSGYNDSLADLARADARIELVDVAEMLGP